MIIPEPPIFSRGFFEPDKLRENVFKNAKDSFEKKLNTIESNNYKLKVSDLRYPDNVNFTLPEQKQAILERRDLNVPLKGKVDLIDKKTGNIVESKDVVLARIPWITQRNTTINKGVEQISVCFHPLMNVLTDQGYIPIGKIVRERMEVNVLSYDFENKEFVYKPIVNWFTNHNKTTQLLKLDLLNSSLALTPTINQRGFNTLYGTENHQFYNSVGVSTPIKNKNEATFLYEKLNYVQRQFLLGSLMGDACLQKTIKYKTPNVVYRESHCIAQKDYLILKRDVYGEFVSSYSENLDKQYPDCSLILKSNKEIRDMRDFIYPGGVKSLKNKWYEEIDEIGLAAWFQDDGSVRFDPNSNKLNIILCTHCFLKHEQQELIAWLEKKWGFKFSYLKKKKPDNCTLNWNPELNGYIQCCGKKAWKFLEIVAPYIHPCLKYKLGQPPRTKKCVRCKQVDLTPTRDICNDCLLEEVRNQKKGSLSRVIRDRFGGTANAKKLAASYAKIENPTQYKTWQDIQKLAGTKVDWLRTQNKPIYELIDLPIEKDFNSTNMYAKSKIVYDIEVADTHNYFINGVLVSNCQSRLKAGVYSRKTKAGLLEGQINVESGTGVGGKIIFDPTKQSFYYQIQNAKFHLYSLLHDFGIEDRQLEKDWGTDVLNKNKMQYDDQIINKLYDKIFLK